MATVHLYNWHQSMDYFFRPCHVSINQLALGDICTDDKSFQIFNLIWFVAYCKALLKPSLQNLLLLPYRRVVACGSQLKAYDMIALFILINPATRRRWLANSLFCLCNLFIFRVIWCYETFAPSWSLPYKVWWFQTPVYRFLTMTLT